MALVPPPETLLFGALEATRSPRISSLVRCLIIARGQRLLGFCTSYCESRCCCFCHLLRRPASPMVRRFVGAVALTVVGALPFFSARFLPAVGGNAA